MAGTLLLVSAALLSFALTGVATHYARRSGLLDHPGERHSHSEPTPRGGGIGWVLAFFICCGLLYALGRGPGLPQPVAAAFLLGMAVLATLGWWDDHRDLGAGLRFVVHLLVALAFGAALRAAGLLPEGALLVVVPLLAWFINLYNFMDGSNGMAGAQGVFVFAVLAVLFGRAGDNPAALVAALLLAGCAGFLPWNLGRARVFMGDVGSLALGFAVGGLLAYGIAAGRLSLPVALMVSALFLVDASLTLLGRVVRGERWYNAHRQHLYQRLIAAGWTHGRVLAVYQAINLFMVLPGVVIGVSDPTWAWPAAAVLALVMCLGWYLSIRKTGELAEAR